MAIGCCTGQCRNVQQGNLYQLQLLLGMTNRRKSTSDLNRIKRFFFSSVSQISPEEDRQSWCETPQHLGLYINDCCLWPLIPGSSSKITVQNHIHIHQAGKMKEMKRAGLQLLFLKDIPRDYIYHFYSHPTGQNLVTGHT